MEDKTGGPAFPCAADVNPDGTQSGITLRDYFAAKAMDALVTGTIANGETHSEETLAKWAYAQADAMLEARGQS